MARKENIDRILRDWPYDAQGISVRKKKGDDGREILQMRLDLGMLQLETKGRPDGQRPQGADSYYDYLIGRTLTDGDEYVMTEEECEEADREFVVLSSPHLLARASRVSAGGSRRRSHARHDGFLPRSFARRTMDAVARAISPLRPISPHAGRGSLGLG